MNTSDFVKEFAGFIDGFEARNQESLRQALSLQIAAMQTSIRVTCNLSDKSPEFSSFHKDLLEIEEAMRQRNDTLIENLDRAGRLFLQFLEVHGNELQKETNLVNHLSNFVRAFIEAAETCKISTVVDLALEIGERFRAQLDVVASASASA